MVASVFDHAGLGAEAGDHRHLAREAGAEGVDGLDTEAMGDFGGVDLFQHPLAHLRRRLDGEGDGDDLFGLFDERKQFHETANQKLGLARARGRLDDERAPRVEGGFAGGLVGDTSRH